MWSPEATGKTSKSLAPLVRDSAAARYRWQSSDLARHLGFRSSGRTSRNGTADYGSVIGTGLKEEGGRRKEEEGDRRKEIGGRVYGQFRPICCLLSPVSSRRVRRPGGQVTASEPTLRDRPPAA